MLHARMWKVVACTLGVLAVLAALAGGAVVYGGLYDVAATTQHFQPVYSLLETAMRHSVVRHARGIATPPSFGAEPSLRRGAACYRDHCVQCHGGPGLPRLAPGLGMQPLPSALNDPSPAWKPRELYWITRHGIRMTGMPAWQFRLADDDLWAVAGFVAVLPDLTPAAYAARVAAAEGIRCDASEAGATRDVAAAPAMPAQHAVSAERGRLAFDQYACTTCHSIPGVTGPRPQSGPPLDGMARRQLIAGRLANTPANMVAWIREPTRIDPQTPMPSLGVTARDAADMAAYLATLR